MLQQFTSGRSKKSSENVRTPSIMYVRSTYKAMYSRILYATCIGGSERPEAGRAKINANTRESSPGRQAGYPRDLHRYDDNTYRPRSQADERRIITSRRHFIFIFIIIIRDDLRQNSHAHFQIENRVLSTVAQSVAYGVLECLTRQTPGDAHSTSVLKYSVSECITTWRNNRGFIWYNSKGNPVAVCISVPTYFLILVRIVEQIYLDTDSRNRAPIKW